MSHSLSKGTLGPKSLEEEMMNVIGLAEFMYLRYICGDNKKAVGYAGLISEMVWIKYKSQSLYVISIDTYFILEGIPFELC